MAVWRCLCSWLCGEVRALGDYADGPIRQRRRATKQRAVDPGGAVRWHQNYGRSASDESPVSEMLAASIVGH